ESVLRGKPKVSVQVENAEINEVLSKVFDGTGIYYQIMNTNLIVLKQGTTITSDTPIQEITVSGKVTTGTGEPIAGVSVIIKGSAMGTTTDEEGNYTLTVPDEATLQFTYVGFQMVEETVNGRAVINVTLQSAGQSMDEVVVVGYGTQRKRDLTGSISSVKGEVLERMPNTNPVASLQGKVAGLTISNTGRAGSAPVVRIRGINSTNSAAPVYVVDGILHDNIDFLNPADIESIDVLRDPSSIAIYGMRGANGVIAVTTRRAARGKTIINYQGTVGVQRVENKIAMTDAAGFKRLYTAQLENINAAPFDFSKYTANTDWQDLIFRDAFMTTNNLSVSNGNDKTTTHLNVGYTNQDGVLKNDNHERFLIRLNQEFRVNKNIKIGGDINGYHWRDNPPEVGVTNALWAAPIVPVQFDDETFYSMPSFQRAQVNNPVMNLIRNDRTSINQGFRLIGSLFAEVKFLNDFTWKSTVYTDLGWNTNRSYNPLPFTVIILGENGAPDENFRDPLARTTVSQSQSENRRFQQDHTLTYQKGLGDHNFTVLA